MSDEQAMPFSSVDRRLREIEREIASLALQVGTIAANVQKLLDASMSPVDLAQVVDRLKAHAVALEAISKNVPPIPFPDSLYPDRSLRMAISPDLQAALDLIDTDTTAVAVTVKSLDTLISTSMTTTDVATVKTTLAAVATRLEGIAADPLVVVPPGPPPAPVAAKKKP